MARCGSPGHVLRGRRQQPMTAWTRRVFPLLILAATLLIAACGGSDDDPSAPAARMGNFIDRAFVAEMVAEQRSTIEIAELARSDATGRFVKGLARDIIRTREREIARMQRVDAQLATARISTGVLGAKDPMAGMKMDAAALRGTKPFDENFIGVMVPHDQRTIELARVELAKGAAPELKMLARKIIDMRGREIEQMSAQLSGGSRR